MFRLNKKDLQDLSRLFTDLTNGKFQLVVTSRKGENLSKILETDSGRDLEFLIEQTLLAAINNILEDKYLKKEAPHLIGRSSSREEYLVNNNPFLWSNVSKEPQ